MADNVREFRLPDIGEGLPDAEILQWYVGPGDTVHDGMPVCEIETAKAVVELPIPYDGVVHEIRHPAGVTVGVGSVIITVASPQTPAAAPAVLVGYGVAESARPRRRLVPPQRRPAAPAARAKPPVRRLARDLGVDLSAAAPSGPQGTVTRDDVLAAGAPTADGRGQPTAAPPGAEQRIPIRGVRKATAEAMLASAFTAPHGALQHSVDITRGMRLIERLRRDPDLTRVRINPMVLVSRAFVLAVRRNPEINAAWDGEHGEIVRKPYVNLGIATATDRGLLVPNIKHTEQLSLVELAGAITELVGEARAGRTAPAALTGGTVTITNIGVFGVDNGTPILNPGESAILAVGTIAERPWMHRGRLRGRQVVTLTLSFDHRLVDGDLGARVLSDTAAVLNDPDKLITWS